MSLEPLKDNSPINKPDNYRIVSMLVNKDLSVLNQENFIVFPQQLRDSEDLNKDNYIFKQWNGKTWTCNVVGVLADGTEEIRINSRFSKKGKTGREDHFLRYMIQTVLNYNIVKTSINSSEETSYYDLLAFLFPYYLNNAMIKGTYKEYVHRDFNDANVKGSIDIARHLKKNIPFVGKIAYRTREFSFDNSVTQLIRHTIEKLQSEKNFLLSGNEDTKKNIREIIRVTNLYSRMDKLDIIQKNILNPVKNGYFEEYAVLQKLCLQILREERIGFGDNENQVNGILIDVAWLWEEYIWKVTGWKHYGRGSNLATLLFYKTEYEDDPQKRYPDFEYEGIPIDTKYKLELDKRNDYNQLATYIHLMGSTKGGFLQSTNTYSKSGYSKLGELSGGGGELFSYKFFVPQKYTDYEDFKSQIKRQEDKVKKLNF